MNAVGYIRLSRDEDQENYQSIINQRKIIQDYAQSNNIIVSNFYEDDNYSGYSFNRPSMNKLIKDLENNKIDIIISKDLSRIGRHNALTLLFLEKIKTLGKRIILIDEGSGGYDSEDDNDDIIGIKTWYNERYIKDISRKIRSVISIKQKEGTLLIKDTFGYIKQNDKLIIKEECANIVREIFNLYIDGNGYRKIATILNMRGCITPSESIKENYINNGKIFKNNVSSIWTSVQVKRILQNDIYIGNFTTSKRTKKTIKGKLTKSENSYVFENHHPEIIEKEKFNLVQELINQRKENYYRGTIKHDNIFAGYLICGDCNKSFVAHNGKNSKRYYQCSTYTSVGKNYCISKKTYETTLIEYFREYLKDCRMKLYDVLNNLNINKNTDLSQNYKTTLTKLENNLRILNDEIKLLLSQKIRDIIKDRDNSDLIEETYKQLEEDKYREIKKINEQINDIKKFSEKVVDVNKFSRSAIQIFDDIINKETPDKKDLSYILKKVIIRKESIEFILKDHIIDMTENSSCYLNQVGETARQIYNFVNNYKKLNII